jgi:hypothetical protein
LTRRNDIPNDALNEKVVLYLIGSAAGEQGLACNVLVSRSIASLEEKVLASAASLASYHAPSASAVPILLPLSYYVQIFQMSMIGVVIVYHFRSYSTLPTTSRTSLLRERWGWNQMPLHWGPLVYH